MNKNMAHEAKHDQKLGGYLLLLFLHFRFAFCLL